VNEKNSWPSYCHKCGENSGYCEATRLKTEWHERRYNGEVVDTWPDVFDEHDYVCLRCGVKWTVRGQHYL